jgi:hypothetical protein
VARDNSRNDDALNELNDNDELWGPLLFLRPSNHQQSFGSLRSLAISLMVGSMAGMLGNLAVVLFHGAASRRVPAVWLAPSVMIAIAFFCCELTFARAWNRRAQRLARAERVDARQRSRHRNSPG